MADSKKKRMSMLDNLAAAGSPAPPPVMSSNRPLRAARDAVDSHKVWDINPDDIVDDRVADRLDPKDVHDLQDSIETTGQTVPILLRRHPKLPEKYLLVYGRRRLEAVRNSSKVQTIRALIAHLDDDTAVEAQISENMARRDLTFIEKALFAHDLIESGFGNQTRVAEVLTVTKSSVSMAIAIVEAIGADVIRAIGPAKGIGRPRWEALAAALEGREAIHDTVIANANRARRDAEAQGGADAIDPSIAAFEQVLSLFDTPPEPKKPASPKARASGDALRLGGRKAGTIRRSKTGIQIDLGQSAFADWIEDQAQDLMQELHDRWEQQQKT